MLQPATAVQLHESVELALVADEDGRLSSPVASFIAVTSTDTPEPPAPEARPVGADVLGAKVMTESVQLACPVRVSWRGA